MSHFFGRRFISGTGDGYTDHGLLTGLGDDDHVQYLITSSIRTTASPTSGINKTGTGSGDVFTLQNSGTGAALFIQQVGNTTSADAALDIDNSGNTGRGLSVSSSTPDPDLPLVQFSALDSSFDEPVVSISHADPCGLALQVLGDAYFGCQIEVAGGIVISSHDNNPFMYGEAGIYVKGAPGEFYFVNKDGEERTWGDGGAAANLLEGCNINLLNTDGYTLVSVDVDSLAGNGLISIIGDDGCRKLEIDFDGYLLRAVHIRKFGYEADNHPFNSVFGLDGYVYEQNRDRLIVTIDGIMQFPPFDYVESSITSIEFVDPVDDSEIIDIILLPGSLGNVVVDGSSDAVTVTMQNAYDDSPSGAKNIVVNDGQITFTQTSSTGSVLRLISNSSVTTGFSVDQNGGGEAIRAKSITDAKATVLVQKDTAARNTVSDTVIIERTTSHASGGLTGIGSGILTRLESTGSNAFNASRITTGTESAADAIERSYLSVELSDDGVLTEHLRLSSDGNLGVGTSSPINFKIQVNGNIGPDADNVFSLGSPAYRWVDGYFGPGSLYVGSGKFYINNGDPYFGHENGNQYNLLDFYNGILDGYGNSTEIIYNDSNISEFNIILCDASSNDITAYLPVAADKLNRTFTFKKIDPSANIVSVSANGTDLVDGLAEQILVSQYDSITVVSNGAEWFII